MAAYDFDAIVIGSGISGGWAAKELTEKGLETLLLDRGQMIRHQLDYRIEGKGPFEQPYRGQWPPGFTPEDYSIPFYEMYPYVNNDRLNPYIKDEERPFDWIRADMFGGRSVIWGRQCYRWSDLDFEANKKDGHGIDWPIRYEDIAPWYSHVEKFVGVSGEKLGLPQLPDGEFQPPMDLNVAEKHFKAAIAERYDGRAVTIGRTANLTAPKAEQGRGPCMYRSQCHRGCSFGAPFSTLSSTLPAADATGNLTLRADAVVESLEYDSDASRVTGVRVIDANTKERTVYRSRVVFLSASAIASTQILLNSRSDAMPNGLGNNHDVLGRYLMDHTFGTGATGVVPGYEKYVEYGRRPTGMYVPRFRNVDGQDADADFVRGYNYQTWGPYRRDPEDFSGFGADLKRRLRIPGAWTLTLRAFCEVLPHRENRMVLDESKRDRFGIPQIRFDVVWRENEQRILADSVKQAVAMLEAAGCEDVEPLDEPAPPGRCIHEMGTARMGDDPRESVVNRWNQLHDAANLFVTDGAVMTSASCVNPSLTYMAFSARAANRAAELVQSNVL